MTWLSGTDTAMNTSAGADTRDASDAPSFQARYEAFRARSWEQRLQDSACPDDRALVRTQAVVGNTLYTHPDGQPMTRTAWYRAMRRRQADWDAITLWLCAGL